MTEHFGTGTGGITVDTRRMQQEIDDANQRDLERIQREATQNYDPSQNQVINP